MTGVLILETVILIVCSITLIMYYVENAMQNERINELEKEIYELRSRILDREIEHANLRIKIANLSEVNNDRT